MSLALSHEDLDGLLCAETAAELDVPPPSYSGEEEDELSADDDDRERRAGGGCPARTLRSDDEGDSIDSSARREAVAWILKVRAYYDFRHLTAYLAVSYMDRFLASQSLPQNVWAVQLLSVACLSLAAKMEEILVPTLMDLQVEGAKFIFEPKTVIRMELLVLSGLGWRLQHPVTPFTYIDFFARKLNISGELSRYLISSASQILLEAMHDAKLLSECPSSLAAAAIIRATEDIQELAFTSTSTAMSWCVGLTEDGISGCCKLMQRASKGGATLRAPPVLSSPTSPPSKRMKMSSNFHQADGDKDSLK